MGVRFRPPRRNLLNFYMLSCHRGEGHDPVFKLDYFLFFLNINIAHGPAEI